MSQDRGEYYHMAPEVKDSTKYSEKADVWSFGVLLTELLMRTSIDK